MRKARVHTPQNQGTPEIFEIFIKDLCIIVCVCLICICAHEHRDLLSLREAVGHHGSGVTVVSHLMWVLETKLRLSGRGAPTHKP